VKLIDILRETADGVDTLPSRDRIRSHDGVYSGQLAAYILWIPSGVSIELCAAFVGGLDESLADESCSQAFKELLVWRAEVVIDVIARGPKRISAGFWELGEAQTCVVGREWFKLDVTVPPGRVVVAVIRGPGFIAVEALALDRRDGADFIVTDAELVGAVENGVDMEGGYFWSPAEFAETEDEFLLEFVG
jgi:hypothetical protein